MLNKLLDQILEADKLLLVWNKDIKNANEYLYSDETLEKLAA